MITTRLSITRKLYRSGESGYQLNGKSCRLKDIRELLMDTGLGTEAYSVIEAGSRWDGLLQSNPVDRRGIFEEAAGNQQVQGPAAAKPSGKLARTQQNLLRVEDVVEEIEKRPA